MVTLNHPASNSSSWYQAVTDNWDTIETYLLDETAVTAKGDLFVARASGVPSKFAIGTDGQVLMADSLQPAGVRWATVHTAGQVAASTVRAVTSDSTTSTSFTDLGSMSLTVSVTSPQKVLVFFNASFNSTNTIFAALQLLRGTTVLMRASIGGQGTWNDVCPLFSLDQPGTGSFTYKVQWLVNSGTGNQDLQPVSAAGDRQLSAILLPA
jgi:hypothetical protein